MPDPWDARHMFEVAEHAATVGDLDSADELLTDDARIEEAELDPPDSGLDLANTSSNLALCAERFGRSDDGETFSPRTAPIVSASLPADHPMVAASRQNFDDFCRANGLPRDPPVFMTISEQEVELGLDAFAPENPAGSATTRSDEWAFDAGVIANTTPSTFTPPSSASRLSSADFQFVLSTPQRSSRSAWVAIGATVLASATALGVMQPWSSRGRLMPRSARTPPPTALPAAGPAALPSTEPSVMSAVIEHTPTIDAPDYRGVAIDLAPASAIAMDGISLATVQLCQSFSTSGGNWRCDPADEPTRPGQIVYFTRVRSPRTAVVEHRWYRGDTLHKTVPLTIQASATEGYRTYSRQIVDHGADWRVEVRTRDGELLHEQRFAVR